MKPGQEITITDLTGQHEIIIKALDDGFCLDCIWCYDNGENLPCNNEFVCDGQAQGGDRKEREHKMYMSKRVYELGGKYETEPILRRVT